jgi:hypothetical protein
MKRERVVCLLSRFWCGVASRGGSRDELQGAVRSSVEGVTVGGPLESFWSARPHVKYEIAHGKETHFIILVHHILHQVLRGNVRVSSELITRGARCECGI